MEHPRLKGNISGQNYISISYKGCIICQRQKGQKFKNMKVKKHWAFITK